MPQTKQDKKMDPTPQSTTKQLGEKKTLSSSGYRNVTYLFESRKMEDKWERPRHCA